MLKVVEVKTKKQLKKFIMFPYKLYANNPYWIPPLRVDEMTTLRWDKIRLLPIARPSTGWYTRTTSLQAGWLESSITGQLRSGAKIRPIRLARFY